MYSPKFFPRRQNYWDVWDWSQNISDPWHDVHFDDLNTSVPSLALSIPQQEQLSYRSGASFKKDENKFEVRLNYSHFKSEEITVKAVDNNIIIHGKHEENMDKNGWVSREFTRKYALPEECEVEKVTSSLNSNGILTIEAPKKPSQPLKQNERVIPIAWNSFGHWKQGKIKS